MVKLSELKAGDMLSVDGNYSCLYKDEVVEVKESTNGLYILCLDGVHYLASQTSFEDFDTLVGLKRYEQ